MPALASGLDYVDLEFLGRPELIATAVLHGPAGVALIDPGPTTTLSHLETALGRKGIQFADIRALLSNNQIAIGGGTPEEFAALIKRETERWGPIIRTSGARID